MNDSHQLALRRQLADILKQERPRGGMAMINAMLEQVNAAELIRAMEPEELHALMLEIGWDDCHELVRYATEEQFQGLTDLNVWVNRDFMPERLEALMGLVASADPEAVERLVESLEPETVGLYMMGRVRVFNTPAEPNDQDILHELGEVMITPDNMFWLIFPPEAQFYGAVKFMIDTLYNRDNLEAVSLFKTMVFEDRDVLQGQTAQFREGRVRSMGFPSLEEADKLFDYTNPVELKQRIHDKLEHSQSLEVGQDTLLPALADWNMGNTPFLREALDAMGDAPVKDEVVQGMAYLANAVIVAATEGDLADPEARQIGLTRAVSLMNLGLEFVSEGNPREGARILGRVWPRTLFRIGHSRTLVLKTHALKLAELSGIEQGFNLFDPPLREAIAGAGAQVPQYFVGLDDEASMEFRDFRSLEDVRKTDVVLEQAEGIVEFCNRILKLEPGALALFVPEALRPLVTHTTLMATALVNGLRGADSLFRPVPLDRVPDVMDVVLLTDESGKRVLNPRLQKAVSGFVSAEKDPFAAALFDLSLRKLEDVFHRLPRGIVPEAKFMSGALLVE